MSAQCWASVADGGPTLYRHLLSVSCLLGYVLILGHRRRRFASTKWTLDKLGVLGKYRFDYDIQNIWISTWIFFCFILVYCIQAEFILRYHKTTYSRRVRVRLISRARLVIIERVQIMNLMSSGQCHQLSKHKTFVKHLYNADPTSSTLKKCSTHVLCLL